MGIKQSQLGYFVGDNASLNDTAVRAILAELYPTLREPDSRRVRCLGHIINLATKAFLFGNDADSFEEDSNQQRHGRAARSDVLACRSAAIAHLA